MNYEKRYKELVERLRPLYEQAKKENCPIWSTYEYICPEIGKSKEDFIWEKVEKAIEGFYKHTFEGDKLLEEVKKLKETKQKSVAKWNELTWEDINTIERIINNVHYEFDSIGERSFGEVVLERFIATKDDIQSSEEEMKPREWSEENEREFNFLINLIEYNIPDGPYSFGDGFVSKKDAIDMLKRLHSNPKEEINLIERLKNLPKEYPLFSPKYGKLWLAEVDEKNGIITCYTNELGEGDTRAVLSQEHTVSFYSNGTTGDENFNVTKDRMLFFLDESHPHWKPSEEQMAALSIVKTAVNDKRGREVLDSLYEQLKKRI